MANVCPTGLFFETQAFEEGSFKQTSSLQTHKHPSVCLQRKGDPSWICMRMRSPRRRRAGPSKAAVAGRPAAFVPAPARPRGLTGRGPRPEAQRPLLACPAALACGPQPEAHARCSPAPRPALPPPRASAGQPRWASEVRGGPPTRRAGSGTRGTQNSRPRQAAGVTCPEGSGARDAPSLSSLGRARRERSWGRSEGGAEGGPGPARRPLRSSDGLGGGAVRPCLKEAGIRTERGPSRYFPLSGHPSIMRIVTIHTVWPRGSLHDSDPRVTQAARGQRGRAAGVGRLTPLPRPRRRPHLLGSSLLSPGRARAKATFAYKITV